MGTGIREACSHLSSSLPVPTLLGLPGLFLSRCFSLAVKCELGFPLLSPALGQVRGLGDLYPDITRAPGSSSLPGSVLTETGPTLCSLKWAPGKPKSNSHKELSAGLSFCHLLLCLKLFPLTSSLPWQGEPAGGAGPVA